MTISKLQGKFEASLIFFNLWSWGLCLSVTKLRKADANHELNPVKVLCNFKMQLLDLRTSKLRKVTMLYMIELVLVLKLKLLMIQDMINSSKGAQLETDTTFFGVDKNRIERWDVRVPAGKVDSQSLVAEWNGGKDYSSRSSPAFTCIATSGTFSNH